MACLESSAPMNISKSSIKDVCVDKCKYFNGTLTVQHMAGIHSNPEPLHSAGLSYHYLPSNSRSWVRLGLMLVGLLR